MAARVQPVAWVPVGLALALSAGLGVLAGIEPRLAVFLAIGLVFAAVALADLTAGLIVLVVVIFAETTPVAGPALSFTKLAGLLVAAAWIARVTTRPAGSERLLFTSHPIISYVLVAFVGWVAVSSLWAESPSIALTDASRFLLVASLYAIVYTALADRKQVGQFLAALIAATAVTAAYGLVLRPEGNVEDLSRLTSTIRDPNVLAAILVAGFVLAAAAIFALRGRTGLRLAAALAAGLCLAALFLTGSRGGLVCFGAALVAAIVLADRWRASIALIAGVVAAGSIAYFTLYAPVEVRERLGAATQGEVQQEEGRFTLWAVAWRVVKDEPVRGVGAGNFKEVSSEYVLEPGTVFRTDRVIDNPGVAHNTYLQILAELGLIGLVLYLAILGFSLSAGLAAARSFARAGDWRMEIMARGVVVATVGVLAANFFISEESGKVVWLLLSLGPAMLAVASAQERPQGPRRAAASSS